MYNINAKPKFSHTENLSNALKTGLKKSPIVLCLGTDTILADCLGPLVAEKLKQNNYPNFIYGGLSKPITSKNAEFASLFIDTIHSNTSKVIIDSMTTQNQSRLGKIILSNSYIGAINNLNLKADLFIYGITSILNSKSKFSYCRLYQIEELANKIATALLTLT